MQISVPDVSSLAFGYLILSTFSQLFLHKEEYESAKLVHTEGQEIHWCFHNDSYMTVKLFTF